MPSPTTASLRSMNFAEATAHLGSRSSRKIAGHTYLEKIDASRIAVRLHDTVIITINRNGSFTLNSGGFRTNVTKDRINACSPAYIHARRGQWYLPPRDGSNTKPFEDGMTVDRFGREICRVNNPLTPANAA